jgi:predicted RNase H-like nuclease (RuvC/YqgF family)
MRLQEELYQHNERLLRENQELSGELARVREDLKVKVKKRDAKVERYKDRCSKGAREVAEERARREEAERRTQIARVKAEARIQEKEFKIQGLKMQLRQMSQMGPQMYTTGVVTPAQISMNQGLPRMYSQNELFGAGNNATQSKMVSAGQQTEYSP